MATQPPPEPITEEQWNTLREKWRDMERAEALMDKMVRAGINQDENRAEARKLREGLMKFRDAFFPGRQF